MTSVRACLAQKGKSINVISVKPDEKAVVALQLMRDNRTAQSNIVASQN